MSTFPEEPRAAHLALQAGISRVKKRKKYTQDSLLERCLQYLQFRLWQGTKGECCVDGAGRADDAPMLTSQAREAKVDAARFMKRLRKTCEGRVRWPSSSQFPEV